MERHDIKEILQRVGAGTASREEEQVTKYWLHYFQRRDIPALSEEELNDETGAIYQALIKSHYGKQEPRPLWARLRTHAGIAAVMAAQSAAWKIAAAVAVMTLGVWLFYASGLISGLLGGRHLEGSIATRDLYANDIAPGRKTATITFDNGEVFELNNNEELSISSESGSRRGAPEVSSETPQFLANRISRSKTVVLSTPRGGTYQVTLPDGTKVWLNADTKIEFPSKFSSAQRKVLLTSGEAYFEVFKNKAKPFIVHTDKQEVTVLGTHFNISAYPDEGSTKTTLLEGSVSVSPVLTSSSPRQSAATRGLSNGMSKDLSSASGLARDDGSGLQSAATILKPNQQAVLTAGAAIQVKTVSAAEAVAWKSGDFRFNHQSIEEIMTQLARWYNIAVVYEGPKPTERFTAAISRNKHISQILKILEKTNAVHFKIEGREVTVSR